MGENLLQLRGDMAVQLPTLQPDHTSIFSEEHDYA